MRNAEHQAGRHDMCLRESLESVSDVIMRWAEDPQERHVFRLNGLAGTGKSTIAQAFAEIAASNGTLGASFFCHRDYLDHKELKNFACQLACRYPAFRSQVIRVVKQYPSVAYNSLISQLKDLIIDPLPATRILCLVIVDALDEYADDQPASAILSALGRFIKRLQLSSSSSPGDLNLASELGFAFRSWNHSPKYCCCTRLNSPTLTMAFDRTCRRS